MKSVAPLVGAWIEIPKIVGAYGEFTSLLSWERGLKLPKQKGRNHVSPVAPLVGAWIEITVSIILLYRSNVAPLVGAWIEILKITTIQTSLWSLLSWERGLKFKAINNTHSGFGRSSRGSVD